MHFIYFLIFSFISILNLIWPHLLDQVIFDWKLKWFWDFVEFWKRFFWFRSFCKFLFFLRFCFKQILLRWIIIVHVKSISICLDLFNMLRQNQLLLWHLNHFSKSINIVLYQTQIRIVRHFSLRTLLRWLRASLILIRLLRYRSLSNIIFLDFRLLVHQILLLNFLIQNSYPNIQFFL